MDRWLLGARMARDLCYSWYGILCHNPSLSTSCSRVSAARPLSSFRASDRRVWIEPYEGRVTDLLTE